MPDGLIVDLAQAGSPMAIALLALYWLRDVNMRHRDEMSRIREDDGRRVDRMINVLERNNTILTELATLIRQLNDR